MTEENLDPKRQLLIAALYGELDAESDAEFRALIEQDPALRAEWDELRETRALLESASEPASATAAAPEFVFLQPATTKPARRHRFFPAFSPAWGFASVACGLILLLGAGLRMDRVDNGLVLRFGPAPVPQEPVRTEPEAPSTSKPILESPISTRPTDVQVMPTAGTLTREDLNRYSTRLLDAMSSRMDEAQAQQNQRIAMILGQFYEEIRDEQDRKYQALRQRVDGVGLGLMSEQTRMNQRISRLIDQGPVNELPSDSLAAPKQPDKEK